MAYIGTKDYFTEVSMGRVTNTNAVNKFGYNKDIDPPDNEEIVASWGGSFNPATNVMATAQTFRISYVNTSDGATSMGARSLIITYLDSSYNEVSAIHTLGSTGNEFTAFTGFGINRVVVLSNGGAGWNVGDILLRASTDGTIQAQIPALKSVTQQCIYHVGINRTFLMRLIKVNTLKVAGGATPTVEVRCYSWSRVTQTRYQVFIENIDASVENTYSTPFDGDPIKFTGREVIYFTAKTDLSNTQINLRFSGIDTITT